METCLACFETLYGIEPAQYAPVSLDNQDEDMDDQVIPPPRATLASRRKELGLLTLCVLFVTGFIIYIMVEVLPEGEVEHLEQIINDTISDP